MEDAIALLLSWLNLWQSKPMIEHLITSVPAGLVGAGMYSALASPAIALPRFDHEKNILHLNIVGIITACVSIALVVDVAFPIGVIASVLTPLLVSVLNRTSIMELLDKTILPGIASIILSWARKKGGGSNDL